jgi:ABC-2 type transport system ATP-binding protein
MKPIIKADKLSKKYDDQYAINALDLAIYPGQIVGLIGPNGAGKTTLLKAIFGLISVDGELTVSGLDPRRNRVSLLQRMCFIADVATLPKWLSVKNAIKFLQGVHPRFSREKALDFLGKTNIPLKKKVAELSRGMVVQLHLALVMAIDADILVLDEPTLGLDILHRKEFYQRILTDYYNENRTIVVATHQVEEIETILTDIIMIDQGSVILDCSMEQFADQFVEVCAKGDASLRLANMSPLSIRNELGRSQFVFENMSYDVLEKLGEVSTPRISDVFVAKIKERSA